MDGQMDVLDMDGWMMDEWMYKDGWMEKNGWMDWIWMDDGNGCMDSYRWMDG